MAFTRVVLRSAATGALGGLLFGFDTAVIAGATHALSGHFSLTPWQLGFTVSIALWGTVVGALSAGKVGQRLGSRDTADHGCPLCAVRRGLRAGVDVAGVPGGSSARWDRDRGFLGSRTGLYRRARARRVSRPPGRTVPDQYCCWNPAGLSIELCDLSASYRCVGVAAGFRCIGHSRSVLPADAFHNSGEPTVAGNARKKRGGPTRRFSN